MGMTPTENIIAKHHRKRNVQQNEDRSKEIWTNGE